MIRDTIGKLLYPRLQRWERRRQVNQLIFAFIGTIVLAAIVVWLSFSKATIGR